MGRREFVAKVKGLSEHSVWRHWVRNEPPEVEGHDAVTALLDRM